jgi:hypothetical protein
MNSLIGPNLVKKACNCTLSIFSGKPAMKNTTFLIQNRQQHKKTKDLSILQLYENKIKPSEREI